MDFLLGFVFLLSLLFGCGSDPLPALEDLEETPEEETQNVPFHVEDELYDQEGNLREGDTRVAGLRLPVGLELDYEEERNHIFRTTVPIEKVVRYFGPRLFTGNVSRIGDGAVYRGAVPKNVEGSPVRLDVSILEIGAKVRVEITELPPLPQNPLPPAELERLWREQQQKLD